MKKLLLITLLVLSFAIGGNAQIKLNLKNKTEKEAERRVNKNTNKAIDKGFDKAEDKIGGLFKKKKNKKEKAEEVEYQEEQSVKQEIEQEDQLDIPQEKSTLTWSKYDFVPGDVVIFEDAPSPEEENGEFPSRWDLYKGNVEIAEFDGETVIYSMETSEFIPYLKDSNKDYLPEVFTLEFDCYFEPDVSNQRYYVYLNDRKNQSRNLHDRIWIYYGKVKFDNVDKSYPGVKRSNKTTEGVWRHISIAYTKGKLKVYLDDTRLVNIPRFEGNPTGITLGTTSDGDNRFIKNIRLAEGGVKYYDRVLQDGKIIVNGIRFDVNKSVIKPESMGAINEIYEIMDKYPDLKFSVEGHTDSDGDDDFNLDLSTRRAQAVVDQLIEMGISNDRLKSKGWGETMPVDNNSTAEGKANNRRVEFVKIN